jgi:hypothetical protein
MWRTQAVISMLLEDVGGLQSADDDALRAAQRRGRWVVALDWLALGALVLLHDEAASQLTLSGGEQTLFTLASLAVAVHSGFRLGQLHTLRALARLRRELEERSEES